MRAITGTKVYLRRLPRMSNITSWKKVEKTRWRIFTVSSQGEGFSAKGCGGGLNGRVY
jgi:hypothetical protein